MKNAARFALLICLSTILAIPFSRAQQASTPVTLSDELRAMYDISLLPAYLDNSTVAQTSSYDITGGNEDGFTGKYSYVRRNPDSSLVIFDMQGPGVITRMWTPTPTADTLDFIIDDQKVLSVKYDDLFSGKVYPFIYPVCGQQLGGNYNYFPILFQKNCRIICRGKKMQFYQIQYKLYPTGTAVKSFNGVISDEEKNAVSKVVAYWSRIPGVTGYNFSSQQDQQATITEISPGETKTIFDNQEGGRILAITLDQANVFEGPSKLIDIKIVWDDEKIPAVYCPVADFFGYAFGKPSMQSMLLGSKNNRNYCFFPMPFDKRAVIQLVYRKGYGNTRPVNIHAKVYFSRNKRDPEKEGRFYTYWNRYTLPGKSHVFLDVKAKGHYVGSILQAQGIYPGMTYFFEGDDSTSVDGQMRIHGTGSEDYFNGGWYALPDKWDRKLSLPLHGCLEYSLPFARTGGYRFYISDKIPFEKSMYESIEHGPEGNKSAVDYTSIGLYYGTHAPQTLNEPINNLTSISLPDTLILYPQLINFGIQDNIAMTSAWKYNTGGLSYSFSVNDESGLKIPLNDIPYGRYRLLMDFVLSSKGCSFSLWQGQTMLTDWVDGNQLQEKQLNGYYLTEFENNEFKNAITIHFKTKPGEDNFILNRLILVRRTE